MSNKITRRVLEVIAQAQRLPLETVTIDKTFAELGIDSMDGVNLLFELETEFNISIPDEATRTIHTVRDMCEGVANAVDAVDTDEPAEASMHVA